jgi:hypothetical protein
MAAILLKYDPNKGYIFFQYLLRYIISGKFNELGLLSGKNSYKGKPEKDIIL